MGLGIGSLGYQPPPMASVIHRTFLGPDNLGLRMPWLSALCATTGRPRWLNWFQNMEGLSVHDGRSTFVLSLLSIRSCRSLLSSSPLSKWLLTMITSQSSPRKNGSSLKFFGQPAMSKEQPSLLSVQLACCGWAHVPADMGSSESTQGGNYQRAWPPICTSPDLIMVFYIPWDSADITLYIPWFEVCAFQSLTHCHPRFRIPAVQSDIEPQSDIEESQL